MPIRLLLLLFAAVPPALQAQTVTTIVQDVQGSGGLSIARDNTLYLADFGSSLKDAGGRSILRLDADGTGLETFATGFGGASGNTFDMDGTLYQSDVARGEVVRVYPDGQRSVFGTGLKTPVGIVPDHHGGAYVTQCVANAITHVEADGSKADIATGEPLNCPNGLATGPNRTLYTVNFRDGAVIQIHTATGAMHVVARLPGGGNGHLAWANDRFYVASFRGGKIYSVRPAGDVCLIAGSGEKGNEDGAALKASFFRPNGVAISSDGNSLYTNTVTSIVAPKSPLLHLNAVRRVTGLKALLDCPPDRRVEAIE